MFYDQKTTNPHPHSEIDQLELSTFLFPEIRCFMYFTPLQLVDAMNSHAPKVTKIVSNLHILAKLFQV